MNAVKRWAFLPLLLVICLTVGVAVANPGKATLSGIAIGLVLTVVFAVVWDRRRRHTDRGRLRH